MEQQYEVIAEGLGSDLQGAEEAEARLNDGDQVELRLYVNTPPSAADLARMQSELLSQGVSLSEPVAYDSGVVVLRYTKSPAPAAGDGIGLAPLIVAGLWIVGTLGIGIFAWQMARQTGGLLSNPLLIFSAVALVIVYFMMKTPDKDKEAQQ